MGLIINYNDDEALVLEVKNLKSLFSVIIHGSTSTLSDYLW